MAIKRQKHKGTKGQRGKRALAGAQPSAAQKLLCASLFLCLIVFVPLCLCAFAPGQEPGFAINNPIGPATVPPTAAGNGMVRSTNQFDADGNLIVTGNVTGGKQFRAPVPYRSETAFRGDLGSTELDSFLRYSSGSDGIASLPAGPGIAAYQSTGSSTSMAQDSGLTTQELGTGPGVLGRQIGSGLIPAFTGTNLPAQEQGSSRPFYSPTGTVTATVPDYSAVLSTRNTNQTPGRRFEDEPEGISPAVHSPSLPQQNGDYSRRPEDTGTDSQGSTGIEYYRQQTEQLRNEIQLLKAELTEMRADQALRPRASEVIAPAEPPGQNVQDNLTNLKPQITQSLPVPQKPAYEEAQSRTFSSTEYNGRWPEPASGISGQQYLQSQEQWINTGQDGQGDYSLKNEQQEMRDEASSILHRQPSVVPPGQYDTDQSLRKGDHDLSGSTSQLAPAFGQADLARSTLKNNQSVPTNPINWDDDSLLSSDISGYNAYLTAGRQYLSRGRFYLAADAYSMALAQKDGDPLACAGKSHALFAAGEYISAASFLSRALQFLPDYAGSNVDLAGMLGGKDKLTERIADAESALARLEQSKLTEPIRRDVMAKMQFLLAYVYLQTGRLDSAKRAIDQAQSLYDVPGIDAVKKAVDAAITRKGQ